MATNVSGEFEEALKRLEEIVGKLERESVALDESVALFKEGKGLAQKCERLLKDAQTSIEAAARGDAPAAAPAAPAAPAAQQGRVTSLFADVQPDDDPDL
jgi:exodeoxyribonuclease VII small subunit